MNRDHNQDHDLERLISRSLTSRSDVIDGVTGSIDDVHRLVDLRRGRRRHVAAFGATAMLAVGAFAMTAIGSSDPTTVPLATPNSDVDSQLDAHAVWRCTEPVAPTDDEGVSYFAHCEYTTIDSPAPATSMPLVPTTTTIVCAVSSSDTATSTTPCTWGPSPAGGADCSTMSRPATVTVPCVTAPPMEEVTHQVAAGDTLTSISAAYGIPIDDIVALNPWDGRSDVTLVEGDTIVIALTPTSTMTTAPMPMPTTVPPSSGVAMYTTRDGDTVGSLANAFNVPVEAIVEANATVADSGATLRSGDTIHIPRNAGMIKVSADAFVTALEQPYRVASGDSVVGIAERFGFLPETLASYNAWADGLEHVLLPDDEIRVPPGGVMIGE